MRAIVCSTLMALIIMTAGARAQDCTRDHELYRIVPEHRAIMLDGGDIKRVMFVDWKDERLNLWKPGHNITYCPDENKMINTTINSVVGSEEAPNEELASVRRTVGSRTGAPAGLSTVPRF